MKLLTVLFALAMSTTAFADQDGAFLDAPYTHGTTVKKLKNNQKRTGANDVEGIIALMTPVRSQVGRGTCSIFSATAMLEGMMRIKYATDATIDLSEEYLEFIAVGGKTSDGSSAYTNFPKIYQNGLPTEKVLPYIGASWVKTPGIAAAVKKCGHLTETRKEACLLVHRDPALKRMTNAQILADETSPLFDPEFVAARKNGVEFRNDYLTYRRGVRTPSFTVYNERDIRYLLDQGRPLVMGIDFYYGAWNHRKADEYGIGRDQNNWSKGIVGYPERGTVDLVESKKNRAGHSILIVGYDDNKVVETTVKMADGTMKTFKYQGVYYFKNSWGTDNFGANTMINDVNYPGYGMITMKYANEMGYWYYMPDSFFR